MEDHHLLFVIMKWSAIQVTGDPFERAQPKAQILTAVARDPGQDQHGSHEHPVELH